LSFLHPNNDMTMSIVLKLTWLASLWLDFSTRVDRKLLEQQQQCPWALELTEQCETCLLVICLKR
jgi:hypothetical protein